jgi:hypothetical protein
VLDVQMDAATAHPPIGEFRAAVREQDWDRCRAVLDAAASPAERTGLAFSGDHIPEAFLRTVLAENPGDGTAAALLGWVLIRRAWEIRGRHAAEHVSERAFRDFHAWLRKAEELLIEAAARDPHNPMIWTARLLSARGLQLGLSEVRRRYDRLAALDPHHLPGQRQLLQSLAPKWSGDLERMHAFARESAEAAPPGSLTPMLVAEAHIEQDLDTAGHLRDPAAQAEIAAAAERSILHAEFRHPIGWVQAANTFAYAFSLGGDRERAGTVFDLLGPYGTETPWDYRGGEPADLIRTYRKEAGR